MNTKNKNTVWHHASVTRKMAEESNKHKSAILWYTGLPSSGKSTIANSVALSLHHKGINCYLLDGDNIRQGLNKDLGFAPEDRKENIRRIGEVARLFLDAGIIVSTAFVSPYIADRDTVRSLCEPGDFIEIYVKCSVDTCKNRDPKGLYKKAIEGIIPEFTGISAPYEEPKNPEIIVDASEWPVEQCVNHIMQYLTNKKYIPE